MGSLWVRDKLIPIIGIDSSDSDNIKQVSFKLK
jgi:hypothetical protein